MVGDQIDEAASDALRAAPRTRRTGDESFVDRGPGYARPSGGRPYAEVDRA
ncbi:hypothetical protein [Micromonospora thermarum]|uniref:Uncharacterized protein n=1 Tax=Micromonospora thermarum TaxID=2720024 RepID=A0ABX0Z254_9ACTN|nr:hypothetical protein [Micromonospora thermarum]NJP31862.1 hypothetical protein [Micromonospora thermarum]